MPSTEPYTMQAEQTDKGRGRRSGICKERQESLAKVKENIALQCKSNLWCTKSLAWWETAASGLSNNNNNNSNN